MVGTRWHATGLTLLGCWAGCGGDYLAPGWRHRVAGELGLDEWSACALVQFWVAAHDIGKIIPSFQQQVQVPSGYTLESSGLWCAHEVASYVWLPSGLDEVGAAGPTARTSRVIAQMLGGHHGVFPSRPVASFSPEKLPLLGLGDGAWDRQRHATLKLWAQVLDPPELAARLRRETAAVLTGLVVLADWVASTTAFVRQRLADVPVAGDVSSMRQFADASRQQTRDVRSGMGCCVLAREVSLLMGVVVAFYLGAVSSVSGAHEESADVCANAVGGR